MASGMQTAETRMESGLMKWDSVIAAWAALNDMIRGHWNRGSDAQKELILVAETNRALRRTLVNAFATNTISQSQHVMAPKQCALAPVVSARFNC
jgi:hypothetical protein